MAYITKDQFKQLMQRHPEENPEDMVNEMINQGHEIEGLNDNPQEKGLFSKAVEFGIGFAKGGVETAKDILSVTSPTPILDMATETITGKKPLLQGVVEKILPEEKLEAKTPLQKAGKITEKVAEIAYPAAKGANLMKARNALNLSLAELEKIPSKALRYLSKTEIRKQPIVGKGILKEKMYQMPEQIRKLADEFYDVVKSGDPNKIQIEAERKGKELWNQTKQLFSGSNPIQNKQQILSRLKNELSNSRNVSYDSAFQKKDVVPKAVESYFKRIKNFTAEGLEEARVAWAKAKRNDSGKLSEANKELDNLIKGLVKSYLPAEKQVIYDAYKTQQAKLFDIETIMGAKKAVMTKTPSLLKKALPGAGIVGGAALLYQGAKKLIQ